MKAATYIPCDALKPYVQSFAIHEADEVQEYKVLPNTGLVIGFQYQGKLSYLEDKQETNLSSAGISGINNSYRVFKNAANTGTVLVFFKEGGAAHFFRQPLNELFRESISLDNFMLRSELLLLEEQLCTTKTDKSKINIAERFLIARMRDAQADPLVLSALALIHQHKGDLRIGELAKQLHTSQSPLEKRFRAAVGTSPKKFAAIVRMKNILHSPKAGNSLTEIGYDAGFYDQAHFIKEFKTFTGETPEQFFKPAR